MRHDFTQLCKIETAWFRVSIIRVRGKERRCWFRVASDMGRVRFENLCPGAASTPPLRILCHDTTHGYAFDGRGRWRDMPELWDERTPERIIGGGQGLDHVTDARDTLPPAQRAGPVLRGQQDLEADVVCEIVRITEGNMRVCCIGRG